MQGAIGGDLVVVLHQEGLGEDRQLPQRAIGQSLVEPAVERRPRRGKCAQLPQSVRLVRFELLSRPAIPLAQPGEGPPELEQEERLHG